MRSRRARPLRRARADGRSHGRESKVAGDDRAGAPLHLRPTAPLAERVLLPGDPGRALALAQALLAGAAHVQPPPRPVGLHGRGPDGEPLTIQATGMGGPSAAIVLTELIALGARARDPRGHLRRARPRPRSSASWSSPREAICADGTSRALGARRARRGRPGAHRPRCRARRPLRGSGRSSASTSSTSSSPAATATRRWRSRWRRRRCSRSGDRRDPRRLRAGGLRHVRRRTARAAASTTTRCSTPPSAWAARRSLRSAARARQAPGAPAALAPPALEAAFGLPAALSLPAALALPAAFGPPAVPALAAALAGSGASRLCGRGRRALRAARRSCSMLRGQHAQLGLDRRQARLDAARARARGRAGRRRPRCPRAGARPSAAAA